jgi:hypothetical protein
LFKGSIIVNGANVYPPKYKINKIGMFIFACRCFLKIVITKIK